LTLPTRIVKNDLIGRDGEIRTHDPMHPMHVRYQAALRPELIKLVFYLL
jgi:hypothetical protein